MLDLITVVQAELSGPRAANYSSLSDADAAAALQNSGQIYQDVTVGTLAGYLELTPWSSSSPAFIFETLQGLAAGTPSAVQMVAAKAVRIATANSAINTVELSDPVKRTGVSAMLDALVSAGMDPANKAAILALGVPVISVPTVTAARILNGVAYPPWSWSQSAPALGLPPNQNPNNIYVTLTIINATTGETQTVLVMADDLTKNRIARQAASAIAVKLARDAALAALSA